MKCTNITSYFYLNVNIYFLVGTACAPGGGCALLVPFRGHSMNLRRWLCPPCFFSWAQHELATVAVPSLFLFVGTACAPGGGCALLVSFHGHSVRSWRRLYPPCFFSWAQYGFLTAAVPSLFLFMGTACACDGGCALARLPQTQTAHIHKKTVPGSYLP